MSSPVRSRAKVGEIQAHLGHESLDTTGRYLARLGAAGEPASRPPLRLDRMEASTASEATETGAMASDAVEGAEQSQPARRVLGDPWDVWRTRQAEERRSLSTYSAKLEDDCVMN
jgi:hypothetical protein